VVEHDLEPRVANALDHGFVGRRQTVDGHYLVVERRQHDDAGHTEPDGVLGERHRIAERGAAGAREQLVGRNALLDNAFKDRLPLVDGKGTGLAGGAQERDPVAALGKQPPAMLDERWHVRGQIHCHRR
jgi:hypothetical protein